DKVSHALPRQFLDEAALRRDHGEYFALHLQGAGAEAFALLLITSGSAVNAFTTRTNRASARRSGALFTCLHRPILLVRPPTGHTMPMRRTAPAWVPGARAVSRGGLEVQCHDGPR